VAGKAGIDHEQYLQTRAVATWRLGGAPDGKKQARAVHLLAWSGFGRPCKPLLPCWKFGFARKPGEVQSVTGKALFVRPWEISEDATVALPSLNEAARRVAVWVRWQHRREFPCSGLQCLQ